MSGEMKFYRISELPSKFTAGGDLFECIGRRDFVIIYDFKMRISLLGLAGTETDDICNRLSSQIPGLGLEFSDYTLIEGNGEYVAFPIYKLIEKFESKPFGDVFSTINGDDFLAILFVNVGLGEVNIVKTRIESILSSKSVRATDTFLTSYLGNKVNSALQREIYNESEERLMLSNVVSSLNKALLSNGLCYKIFALAKGERKNVQDYVNGRFLVLGEYRSRNSTLSQIVDYLSRQPCLPFGMDYAKEFINIQGYYNVNHNLATVLPQEEEGIEIGKFMRDGVLETELTVRINPSALNLGFLITGLPGSGKTREAMSIINSLLLETNSGRKPAVFVITPTKEWVDFALTHDMFFVRLYEDDTPINFFRCPETIETEKFYGNLAMILSSSANAGPYRNPMEKCMSNAFKRIYARDTVPDPIQVYNEIEEVIVKYHGKRGPNGVKYTKHGENIKSALENLRGILSQRQYSVKNGIKIENFLENGAVFDVSSTSAGTKTQLYALILNQIYALANSFDTNGDNELRLVICLEEAQTIFGDPESPTVKDIQQRIQDFRKQGIGLILLAHNVTDIDVGIRRLCQLKLYLKQAPDTALLASKDLIFANIEQEELTLKLKTLGSRVGAFSGISKSGNDKIQKESLFVKTRIYADEKCNNAYNQVTSYLDELNLNTTKLIKCRMTLKLGDRTKIESKDVKDSYYVRISFLGEELTTVPIKELDSNEFSLLEGKTYAICILNNRKKTLKEFYLEASGVMYLDISE